MNEGEVRIWIDVPVKIVVAPPQPHPDADVLYVFLGLVALFLFGIIVYQGFVPKTAAELKISRSMPEMSYIGIDYFISIFAKDPATHAQRWPGQAPAIWRWPKELIVRYVDLIDVMIG